AGLVVIVGLIFALRNQTATAPFSTSRFQPIANQSIQVEELRLEHIREMAMPGKPRVFQGMGAIGTASFATRFGDRVRVQCRLSGPGYCFLLAYNPDGSEQLCYPANVEAEPESLAELRYPQQANSDFVLDDGTGFQAFVLVVAHQPLP